MYTSKLGFLAAVAIAGVAAFAAQADEVGRAEYMNACASCHGASGAGDGPLAELMTVDLPDLRTIAARNDGVFPMLDVLMVIDGRTGVRGHGYPMPVWGDRFEADAAIAEPYGQEVIVRGRVLSLAYHIESLQD